MASELEASDFENEDLNKTESRKAPDVTYLEQTVLFDLINEYKNVVENKSKNFGTSDRKQKTRDVIANRFNAQSNVKKRTAKHIRLWWDNKEKPAKKSVTKKKPVQRKTGGGTSHFVIPPDAERVISMIPSQMNPLDKTFDSDFQPPIGEQPDQDEVDLTGEQCANDDQDKENVDPGPSPSNQGTKRKYKDPRSSLTDMEYEEHKVRLKTLYIQHEEAQIQRDIARSTAEFKKEEQKLTLELLTVKLQQHRDAASTINGSEEDT